MDYERDDSEKGIYEKEFENKVVMITGGLGFIGSNLAHRLVKLKTKRIIIIDALIPRLGGSIDNVKEIINSLDIPYLNEGGLNINDRRVIDYLEDVDYIFNLAGSVSHVDSKNRPLDDLKINLFDHVSFLENCKKYIEKEKDKIEDENERKDYKPKFKILFSATRDIYGKTMKEDLPLKEDFIIREVADPQGIHNHSAEFHHLWFGKNFDIQVVSLRLSNTYGPRQKIKYSTQGFLGHFIYKILKDDEIELWGGGESLRDFNYVEDVIDAMLIAMVSSKSNEVYNLGSFMRKNGKYQDIGENICSVGDAAKRLIKIANIGRYKEISYPENKKNIEPGHVYLDATKIYDDLGWYPKTSFNEGIIKTINFYKNNNEYLLKDNEIKKIPFLDLKQQHESLKGEIEDAMSRVIKNSNFILGNEVREFEKEFSSYCNKEYGIGVGSGTDALKIALMALGVGRGDEVIVPANTAIPTVMAIKDVGAEPCLVDCNEDYLMNVDEIEEKINERTKIIMPVHLYGRACDMDRILEIANKHNLEVVEDCCQAHGAKYYGKKVPIGNIGCFSFYPSKNLGGLGDGGMIVGDSSEFNDKVRLLRNYGQKDKYHSDILGVNSRLDEMQAAILRVKLKYLDEFNEKRRKIARLYNELLKDVVVPSYDEGNVYHLYVVRVRERERLIEYLKEKEIGSLIHYPVPIHKQKAFSNLSGSHLNTEKFSGEILSLPIYPELGEGEVRRVCEAIDEFYD